MMVMVARFLVVGVVHTSWGAPTALYFVVYYQVYREPILILHLPNFTAEIFYIITFRGN